MSVSSRVEVPAGETVQIIPPDGVARVAMYEWVIRNPGTGSAAVDLVAAAAEQIGEGYALEPGDPPIRLLGRAEAVYAAGGSSDGDRHRMRLKQGIAGAKTRLRG